MFKKSKSEINKVHLSDDKSEIGKLNNQSSRANLITPIQFENDDPSSSLQNFIDNDNSGNGSVPNLVLKSTQIVAEQKFKNQRPPEIALNNMSGLSMPEENSSISFTKHEAQQKN